MTIGAGCPNCGSLAADSCPDCDTAVAKEANFCSQCGRALRLGSSQPPVAPARSVRAPAHLTERVFQTRAALEGERKQVTVLFADLRGSLSVIDGVDPEEVQALLDAVLGAMVDAVHRYEGAVNQTLGDGIMALFGAPIAHEDHALRAACAALAMQEAVQRLQDATWAARGVRPQIRVGLNSGEVAIRTVRNDLSMEYRAVGSTTHLAARMEQLAKPGAVYLTADTLRLGRGLLRTRVLGPVTVKGMVAPVEVFELTGISVRTRFQANALRGLSPLVGRQEALAELVQALRDAGRGRYRAIALCGEPGIGKSRLCHELIHHAPERFRVLEASAMSYAHSTPYGVLANMVRSLFGIEDDDDLERVVDKARACLAELGEDLTRQLHVALELLDVPGTDRQWARLDPVQKRRHIEALLRAVLAAFCARAPAILVFEDLHWCDPDSLAFISSLVECPPSPRTLLVLTHRPDLTPTWSQSPHVRSRRLSPLDAQACQSLLKSLLGDDARLLPVCERLASRTDGNPFFLEESARSVLESTEVRRQLARPDGAAPDRLAFEHYEVPASIEALLGARVDRLPEAALELLQAAAVIGDDAPLELLRLVADAAAPDFAARLASLTRAELLYQSVQLTHDAAAAPIVRFKHALVQEVVYKRLVRPRKRALHARVLSVLEQHHHARSAEHVERLAEHAQRAQHWDKCVEYRKRACVRAASRSANPQAIAHLDRGIDALAQLPQGPERARAAIDLHLTALAALLPVGAHTRAIALLREAEQYARALGDARRLAQVLSQLSVELWLTAQYDLGLQAAEQSLSLAGELPGDQFALEISARYSIATIQHARGEFEAAARNLRELSALFSGKAARRRLGWVGYPSVMLQTFLIAVAAMTGDFEEANAAFARGRAVADELDHAFSRTMIMEQYAMCLRVKGEPEAALGLLREAMDICRRDEVATMYAPIASQLGSVLLELGQVQQGRALLEEVAGGEIDRAGHYAIDYMRLGLSAAYLRSGDVDRALAAAERVVNDTEGCGERGFHVQALLRRADALAAQPEHAPRALQGYARALEAAQQLGMQPWVALAHEGMARVYQACGRVELGARALEAAVKIWTVLGAPGRIARVQSLRDRIVA